MLKPILKNCIRIILSIGLFLTCSIVNVWADYIYYLEYEVKIEESAASSSNTLPLDKKEIIKSWYARNMARIDSDDSSNYASLDKRGRYHYLYPTIPADVPAAVREEILRLRDPSREIRIEAAHALGNLGEEAVAAVPFLLPLLKERSPSTAYRRNWKRAAIITLENEAIKALRQMGKPGVNAVTLVLKSQDSDQRKKAVCALGGMGQIDDPVIISALATVIKEDRNWKVRQLAVLSLKDLGSNDPLVVSVLLKAVREEPSGFVRAEAIRQLGEMGGEDKEIVEALKNCLSTDEESEVRKAAASALAKGQGPDRSFIDSLIKALKTDTDSAVRAETATILGSQARIPGKLSYGGRQFFVQGKLQKMSEANSSSILDVEYKKVAGALRSAILTDRDRSVQKTAITALGNIRGYDDESIDVFLQVLLKSPYMDLRLNAAQALQFSGRKDDKIIKALLTALQKDREEAVRLKVVQSLRFVGRDNSRVEEVLRSILKSTTSVNLEKAIQNTLGIHTRAGGAKPVALKPVDKALTAEEKKAEMEVRIERMVRSYLPGLRRLLRDAFQKDPSCQGTMDISFQISDAGNLAEAAVISCSPGLAPLKEPILDQVRLWKFSLIAKEYGKVDITYSFVFQEVQNMGKPAYKTLTLVAKQR